MSRAESSKRGMSRIKATSRFNSTMEMETIASWSEAEQSVLNENLVTYPAESYTEFKRLALLLTNLPTKRLRDVSLRLQYMKLIEEKKITTWEDFIKSTLSPRAKSERLRRDSPSRSPRTPKSAREHGEAFYDSPRYKRPTKGKSITPQNTAGLITRDPQKLIEENEFILRKIENSLGNVDIKDCNRFNFNCFTVMDTTKFCNGVVLPVLQNSPIKVQQADLDAKLINPTGELNFKIGKLSLNQMNNIQNTDYVLESPQILNNVPLQLQQLSITQGNLETQMQMTGSNEENTQGNQNGTQNYEGMEEYQQEQNDSFINGSFGGYGLTVSSLTSQ
ncbi:hypothetical protein EIN_162310 [Entamoeba invadens IP1]|uniref:Myb-like domain-containing protein n=2 Tax=Entamoeba invadens TaxID=33085 RepID=A0A0A1U1V3_ENTIV|nr:hypothetical protein EIN_162310 [Entamoeba invadens IP1]ELP86597.1 hypothetical protein EIN_162310 [Entamoeba invadens IP1]BAN41861.1 hypothetical protein [Entamoeba invadens]|eukprot:XP_004185943.1 hypothetical protein EIN_162310 [Entamoeba invadens IP1]